MRENSGADAGRYLAAELSQRGESAPRLPALGVAPFFVGGRLMFFAGGLKRAARFRTQKKTFGKIPKVFFIIRVVGVGVEPTNSIAGRIYSPHPLASWIPHRLEDLISTTPYHFVQSVQDFFSFFLRGGKKCAGGT